MIIFTTQVISDLALNIPKKRKKKRKDISVFLSLCTRTSDGRILMKKLLRL